MGVLGVDVALEGPFSKKYNGSYLINYRYSTLGILNNFNVLPDETTQYQDLSFKFNFPTRKGHTFTLFGLGGDAQNTEGVAVADSTQWEDFYDSVNERYTPKMGVIGASHLWLLGPNTYVKTITAITGERRLDKELALIPSDNYREQPIFDQDTQNWSVRGSVLLNHKFNARQTIQVGVNGSHLGYNLITRNRNSLMGPWETFLDQKGSTRMLKSYVQLKYRPTPRLTVTPGVHYTYFELNGNQLIEPRLGASWKLSESSTVSAGIGLHSRVEPTAIYLANRLNSNGENYLPHRNLDLMQAWHYVAGFDHYFTSKLRFKMEAYYQYLYDIPVAANVNNPIFSTINTPSVWDIVFDDEILVNRGTGENYGVELTLEKFLSKGYYYLLTGSIYDARYTPLDGRSYHSRYAGNYVVNLVGGKEFPLKNKNLLGFNARFILAGGNRYTPLDVNRSITEDRFIFDVDNIYGEQVEAYYRLDFGVSYTVNKSALTHAIRFDIQNITSRENVQGFDYNRNFERVPFFHTGLIPILSYKVTF